MKLARSPIPHYRGHYHGKSYLQMRLPREAKDWSHGGVKSIARDGDDLDVLVRALSHLNDKNAWNWPKRKHYFFSDLHADADAFAASLVASGGVKKTGAKPGDFTLTTEGKQANFIIGGDCFDKGPSTLTLLRTIHGLIKKGARVRLLAGNHDVRVLFGMSIVGMDKDHHNEHFFIRTGQKIIPLLKEIWHHNLKQAHKLKGVPSLKECRRRLFVSDDWFEAFPKLAHGSLQPAQITRELQRIRSKQDRFEKLCLEHDLTLRHVYAATQMWKKLFLKPSGEFFWFYKRMRLSHKAGSFLFVHAGLDNIIAKKLHQGGVKEINHEFRTALNGKPFDFYYGPLCNTVRTKYRDVDLPFSEKGARAVRHAGISAVIHGHRNLHNGQRLAGRKTMLSFECDASLDSHTRFNEKVQGRGAAVTIVEPKGYLLGVSSDYPYVKIFEPHITLRHLKNNRKKMRRLI